MLNLHKVLFAIFISSILFLGACSKDKDNDETIKEKVNEEEIIKEEEAEEAEELAADIFLDYFNAIHDKDFDKMGKFMNQESIEQFKALFETTDIKIEVISYDAFSRDGDHWEFDVEVEFKDANESGDFEDNVSKYRIGIDLKTKEIINSEVVSTIPLNK